MLSFNILSILSNRKMKIIKMPPFIIKHTIKQLTGLQSSCANWELACSVVKYIVRKVVCKPLQGNWSDIYPSMELLDTVTPAHRIHTSQVYYANIPAGSNCRQTFIYYYLYSLTMTRAQHSAQACNVQFHYTGIMLVEYSP